MNASNNIQQVKKLAFVGLGVMGFPMAGHLAGQEFKMCVYNRSAEKSRQWVEKFGHSSAETPKEAAKDADIVFICVGNDDDLREVTLSESGVLVGMKTNAILVDHTTASANIARALDHACAERNFGFLDAPVSGGQAGAENGVLTIMVGGGEASFSVAEPVMQAYARAVTLMGPAGSGQLTKMVNQICIAGLLQGLSEGINFANKAGLDSKRAVDVISKGAAQSWQMENRGHTMIDDEFEFGFAVDWMRKDLSLCMEEANRNGALLPVAALVDQFYANVQKQGGGRWDTSSLIRILS